MTEDTALDTRVPPLSVNANEIETLLFALDRSRATLAWKCSGLDTAGLNRPHPPSTMTLGGLMKHLALVEDYYTATDLVGQPIVAPWDAVDFDADPQWEWRTAAEDSPDELYALWNGAVQRSRAAVAAALAGGGLDQQAKSVRRNGQAPNLRRVLTDLHEEYARHVGHADLLREAVDGLVGEDPPQR